MNKHYNIERQSMICTTNREINNVYESKIVSFLLPNQDKQNIQNKILLIYCAERVLRRINVDRLLHFTHKASVFFFQ